MSTHRSWLQTASKAFLTRDIYGPIDSPCFGTERTRLPLGYRLRDTFGGRSNHQLQHRLPTVTVALILALALALTITLVLALTLAVALSVSSAPPQDGSLWRHRISRYCRVHVRIATFICHAHHCIDEIDRGVLRSTIIKERRQSRCN